MSTSVTIVIDGRPVLTHTINGTYSRPDGAPLLIGVKSENYPDLELANLDLFGFDSKHVAGSRLAQQSAIDERNPKPRRHQSRAKMVLRMCRW